MNQKITFIMMTLKYFYTLNTLLVVKSAFGSSQRLKKWHLLLPQLAFTIKGLEQGGLAQCQFKMTGWGIMFIYGMVLQCDGTITLGLSLDQLQQIRQPLSCIALNC